MHVRNPLRPPDMKPQDGFKMAQKMACKMASASKMASKMASKLAPKMTCCRHSQYDPQDSFQDGIEEGGDPSDSLTTEADIVFPDGCVSTANYDYQMLMIIHMYNNINE